MKTLMDAPETSPLAMVNVEDIGLFYVQVLAFFDMFADFLHRWVNMIILISLF
jgi:hypothetical protein